MATQLSPQEIIEKAKHLKKNNTKLVAVIKDVNNVKDAKDVKNDKDVKRKLIIDESADYVTSSKSKAKPIEEEALSSVKAFESEEEALSSLRGGNEVVLEGGEVSAEPEGIDFWKRIRFHYYEIPTNQGVSKRLKLILTNCYDEKIILWSCVGRRYDFKKGVEDYCTIDNVDPWYAEILPYIWQANNRTSFCGKFYEGKEGARAESKSPIPYTAALLEIKDDGAYQLMVWLDDAVIEVTMTDTTLTKKQTTANQKGEYYWFNQKYEHKSKRPNIKKVLGKRK